VGIFLLAFDGGLVEGEEYGYDLRREEVGVVHIYDLNSI
jgi:hypothetical protein